jgi:hypothetical protein
VHVGALHTWIKNSRLEPKSIENENYVEKDDSK